MMEEINTAAQAAVHVLPTIVKTEPVGLFGTTYTVGNVLQAMVTLFTGGTLFAALKVLVMWRQARDNSSLALRKLEMEEDSSLRRDLLKRVADLESQLTTSDARCDARIAEMRREYDSKLAAMEQIYTSTMGLVAGAPPSLTTAARLVVTKLDKEQPK